MLNYNEMLDRINLFYDVLNADTKRMGYVEPEERADLKDKIMGLSEQALIEFKEDFLITKDFSMFEMLSYKQTKPELMPEEEIRPVALTNIRSHILDFKLDEQSLSILNNSNNTGYFLNEANIIIELSDKVSKNTNLKP